MAKSQKYIAHHLEVEVLSPLHIGSGETLTSAGEFFPTDHHIHFVDQDALIKEITAKNKMQEYLQMILSEGEKIDFKKKLEEEWGIKPVVLHELKFNQTGGLTTKNNILHRCVKTADQAFVPGSSLKGLFRTALLFNFLEKNNKSALNEISGKLKKNLDRWEAEGESRKRKLNGFGKAVENEILKDIQNVHSIQHQGGLFHHFRPEDSAGVAFDNLVIEQVQREFFFNPPEEEGELDWLMETIPEGTSIPFALTLYDFPLRTDLPFLFEAINNCTKHLINLELKLLQKTTQYSITKVYFNLLFCLFT